ncbi:hypothetical protein RSOLAG1IB_11480 [Rhizoctonia solani AG-1 IB]|uniref:Uncharacterized protein n=1 Tax=Thanatephorus cucumeris (strain AG1-IB / isolate 7/3/14) TaxID=1108050 RepID=A0A0B7FA07_THACB|nr:hypothetical protein RSOLAG1IB_11480 [Rhizoctonia solani AG-1 IB]
MRLLMCSSRWIDIQVPRSLAAKEQVGSAKENKEDQVDDLVAYCNKAQTAYYDGLDCDSALNSANSETFQGQHRSKHPLYA